MNEKSSKHFRIDPMVLFFLAGGLIFVLNHFLNLASKPEVIISQQIQATMVKQYEQLTVQPVSPEDRNLLIKGYLTDELLFRDAIARGMYLTDPTVRKDLIKKRRYQIAGNSVTPTREDLLAYYSANLDSYRSEQSYSVRHVFFRDLPEDSKRLLKRLNDGEKVEGEKFRQGRYFPEYSVSALSSVFGKSVVDQIETVEVGPWFGPLKTSRGWHFMHVEKAIAPFQLPFEQVEKQVERDYTRAHTQDVIDAYVDDIRNDYKVVIE